MAFPQMDPKLCLKAPQRGSKKARMDSRRAAKWASRRPKYTQRNLLKNKCFQDRSEIDLGSQNVSERFPKGQKGLQAGSKMGLREAQVHPKEPPIGTGVFKTVPRLI